MLSSIGTGSTTIAYPLLVLAVTAGLLLSVVSPRWTIAVLAGCGLALAVWGTLSPSIREAPRLSELDDVPARDVAALAAPHG